MPLGTSPRKYHYATNSRNRPAPTFVKSLSGRGFAKRNEPVEPDTLVIAALLALVVAVGLVLWFLFRGRR